MHFGLNQAQSFSEQMIFGNLPNNPSLHPNKREALIMAVKIGVVFSQAYFKLRRSP